MKIAMVDTMVLKHSDSRYRWALRLKRVVEVVGLARVVSEDGAQVYVMGSISAQSFCLRLSLGGTTGTLEGLANGAAFMALSALTGGGLQTPVAG